MKVEKASAEMKISIYVKRGTEKIAGSGYGTKNPIIVLNQSTQVYCMGK